MCVFSIIQDSIFGLFHYVKFKVQGNAYKLVISFFCKWYIFRGLLAYLVPEEFEFLAFRGMLTQLETHQFCLTKGAIWGRMTNLEYCHKNDNRITKWIFLLQ